MKKITKNEKYEMLKAIPEVAENTMLMEFINHEQELNSKKHSKKADTETTEAIKELVLYALSEQEQPVTVSELLQNEELKAYTYVEGKETKILTGSKVTSMLKKLEADGKVVNTKDKKRSLYAIVED